MEGFCMSQYTERTGKPPLTRWSARLPSCWSAGQLPTRPLHICRFTGPLGRHTVDPLGCRLPSAKGGFQHHQILAANLPRRHRETGLYDKGVTPELLRLKSYCSWTGDFFFSFFIPFSLSVCLVHCLSVHHFSLLISLVLHFLFFFLFLLLFSPSFLVLLILLL
jgi:hypothetical protein